MANPNSAAGSMVGIGIGAAMGAGMAQQAGPWGAAPVAPPAPPPRAPAEPVWHIAAGGEVTGPFDRATLASMAATGRLSRASQVWTPGQDGWKAVGDTALDALFAEVPPPPPAG